MVPTSEPHQWERHKRLTMWVIISTSSTQTQNWDNIESSHSPQQNSQCGNEKQRASKPARIKIKTTSLQSRLRITNQNTQIFMYLYLQLFKP